MNNILLGKTVKAMYKLSGKTLTELSEKTGLTVDTINNLFYARLQKPGFFGVSALVKATGYTPEDLFGFMESAVALPESADITEEFTKYLFSAESAQATAESAKQNRKTNKDEEESDDIARALKEAFREQERQLDRYREIHFHYVEELHARYRAQIEQMEESEQKRQAFDEKILSEIRKDRDLALEHAAGNARRWQKINLFLSLLAALLAAAVIVLALV